MAGRGHRYRLAGEVVAGEVMSSPPKSWMDIARDEAKLADDRMEEALQTAKNALHEYKVDPTRIKRINYLAAKRRYRERKAQQEEWWS